ncbi:acyltransferase [Patulibacter sp.]|uniref:acyltransferase family protein n=1 Tax=Patulibacter sp. TaxID=1912859 RepID=UPI0027210842|nr:acyltransferase [Patulibacter sp.]MDO9410767.1 acyltransferase [Patulibacter sp.]
MNESVRAVESGGASETVNRVLTLDAIRGIAIGLVLLRHAFPDTFGAGGFVGVELFFVLSGFLITGILVRDATLQRLSLRRFYLNRALRLVPALVVVVVVVAVVASTAKPLNYQPDVFASLVTALTYTSDIPGWPLSQYRELTHLWTLAIEEQFYLVWPFVIIWATKRYRSSITRFAYLGVVAGLVLLLLTAFVAFLRDVPSSIYTWPTTWTVTLLAGGALAVSDKRQVVGAGVAWAALLGMIGISLLPDAKGHISSYVVVVPAVAIGATALIANATGPNSISILHFVPLQQLGTISYGAYLWNYPIAQWVPGIWSMPLTIVAAVASYAVVEKQFLRMKRPAPRAGDARPTGHLVALGAKQEEGS